MFSELQDLIHAGPLCERVPSIQRWEMNGTAKPTRSGSARFPFALLCEAAKWYPNQLDLNFHGHTLPLPLSSKASTFQMAILLQYNTEDAYTVQQLTDSTQIKMVSKVVWGLCVSVSFQAVGSHPWFLPLPFMNIADF